MEKFSPFPLLRILQSIFKDNKIWKFEVLDNFQSLFFVSYSTITSATERGKINKIFLHFCLYSSSKIFIVHCRFPNADDKTKAVLSQHSVRIVPGVGQSRGRFSLYVCLCVSVLERYFAKRSENRNSTTVIVVGC